MKRLNENEVSMISGGGVWMWLGLSALVVFLSGVLRGYTNGERCRDE